MKVIVRKRANEVSLSNDALASLSTDEVKRRLDGMMGSGDTSVSPESLSPAARRYARIAAKSDAPPHELIKRIDVEGEEEPYFIRAFDSIVLTRYNLHISRTKDGRLDLTDNDKTQSWLATLLWCGVVQGEDDIRPYFTLRPDALNPMGSAWEWVQSIDPRIKKCAGVLQHQIILHNLDYFNPEAHREAEEAYRAAGLKLDEREKKESKELSTMPGLTSPADGSTSTTSTLPLPPSATDSIVEMEPNATDVAMLP